MCGRYQHLIEGSAVVDEYNIGVVTGQDQVGPRYNIAPTQYAPVIRQTDRHAEVAQYGNSHGVTLTVASEDTRELSQVAAWCLRRIFRGQHSYKKAGVMLTDLGKREARQPGLYDKRDHAKTRRLMAVMDGINRDHGKGTLRVGSASPMTLRPCRTWHMRSDNRSPRWTTRWGELPVARARA